MKRLFLLSGIVLGTIALCYFLLQHNERPAAGANTLPPASKSEALLLTRLKSRVTAARSFIRQHKLSEKHCFLIDMSIPSGRLRFFVYDLEKNVIVRRGLVAHGSCNEMYLQEASFSNVPNSGCSSLGRYKVGYSYNGNFGKAYKLFGLDGTNSNAFKRFVVLHSYWCVPNSEVYPAPICNSLGCPMVSPRFLDSLKPLIDGSQKPIMLWIFS